MGELRPARDIADGKGAAVGRAQPRVDGDPLRAGGDPGGGEIERLELGRRPAATSRCEPGDPLAVGELHRDARRRRARRERSRPAGAARCLRRRAARRGGSTSSGSSRGSSGPRSSTVTRAPSRRCACAISMPIGPPPITIRCSGSTRLAKTVSLVRYGSRSSPGIGGTAGREPVAITNRRGRISTSPARTVRGLGEPRLGAQHGDAEPFEPLGRIVGRDVGDHPLDAVADRGEIDLRRAHRSTPSCGAAPPQIREPGRGEQRLRRHAAEIQAVAAHRAALDQHDLGAELRRAGGDRQPAGAGADDAQIGGRAGASCVLFALPPLVPDRDQREHGEADDRPQARSAGR